METRFEIMTDSTRKPRAHFLHGVGHHDAPVLPPRADQHLGLDHDGEIDLRQGRHGLVGRPGHREGGDGNARLLKEPRGFMLMQSHGVLAPL
jgi:hypothetical protein